MSRVPAHLAGTVAKLYDFKCPKCNGIFESMATQAQINDKLILCPQCEVAADKVIIAAHVDSYAAAGWRR